MVERNRRSITEQKNGVSKIGLFQKIFGNSKPPARVANALTQWEQLTAYRPVFTNWGGNIYESELVRAAIHVRATHISKLKIEIRGAAKPKLQTRLKAAPNDYQTWSQWLYRTSTILDVTNNCFIVPEFDKFGEIVGIYSVLPSRCEIAAYNEVPYLRYEFSNGNKAAVELSKCGILTKHQFGSDYFGETNDALKHTMELINIQNQGIAEGVKSAATYRFMAQLANFSSPEDLEHERKMFSRRNFSEEASGGGLLLFPNTYKDIRQIDSKPFVIDAEQMELINTNVKNYYNVSEKIMQSTATDAEMDGFFNTVVEWFSIQLSEVLTQMLYTRTEQAYGSEIVAVSNRLQYMSVPHKAQLAKELGDRGAITIDEIRELFNYAPLPDGAGAMAPIRGEYYDAADTENNTEGSEEDASET